MVRLICIDTDYYIAASSIASVRAEWGQGIIVTTHVGSQHLVIAQNGETPLELMNKIVAEVNQTECCVCANPASIVNGR